jgi:hypothetical protein
VLPHALDVARHADGTPDFRVELVRVRRSGSEALAAYGSVDFRVVPVLGLDAARQAVSSEDIEPGDFAGGWLRLMVRDPGTGERTTLLPPVRVESNGISVFRLSAHLTAEAVSLLKRALMGGAVLVDAWAEMEVPGIAPRLPVVVELRTSVLDRALEGLQHEGMVARADVVGALTRPDVLAAVPGGIDRVDLAEAVADRLRTLRAILVPSPKSDASEWWRLESMSPDAALRWDLSEPAAAVRMTVLRFDPIGLVRRATAAGGLERLVTERELTEFSTGFVPVSTTANLPQVRSAVLTCGVDIVAEPALPHRKHVVRETIEFAPPEDRGDVVLRLSPAEPPDYDVEPWVLLRTLAGPRLFRSPRRRHRGSDLRLAASDFAVRWIPVSGSAQLLREGAVTVSAHWDGQMQTIALARERPSDTLAVPAGAEGLRLEVAIRKGERVLRAPVATLERSFLDLTLFKEFGSHTVDVNIDFADAPDVLALDLRAEGDPETSAVTLSFSTSRPQRTWTWFAASPFAPGYCYRLFRSTPPPHPWSAPQPPFAPLRLIARNLAAAADASPAVEGVP